MLWTLLIASTLGGGHIAAAIFYALVALTSQPRCRRDIVLTTAPRPASAPSACACAVELQRSRRLHLIKGARA